MPLPSTLARFSSWRRAGIRVGLRVGFRLGLGLAATLAVAAGLPSPALAQQAAHTHGRLDLAVALDATAITIRLESPLDNFLGFERAPRTDDERRRVADLAARLRAADQWLRPDPAARCRLARVDLDSAVPGLGKGDRNQHDHDHDHGHDHQHDQDNNDDHDHDHDHGHGHEPGHDPSHRSVHAPDADAPVHADLDMTVVFACPNAAQARFLDVGLFESSPRLRQIDARIASPRGQFRRSLTPGAARIDWSR